MLERGFLLSRERERRRRSKAVVAFSIGWVEGETALAHLAKVPYAHEDKLLIREKVFDEICRLLQACGYLEARLSARFSLFEWHCVPIVDRAHTLT